MSLQGRVIMDTSYLLFPSEAHPILWVIYKVPLEFPCPSNTNMETINVSVGMDVEIKAES